MSRKLRWGILGTGNIARQFATGVQRSERGSLGAVASRQAATAHAFAGTHAVERSYDNYDAILRDPDVDAIYVSLPNSMHHEWTIKSLRAGKHVLCEKPIATNAQEAEEMFDVAKQTGRVLVEAFMYRSHPLTHAVIETVRSGAIGPVRLIRTSFCYRTTRIAENIRFNPELSGGALMDVGCYCTNFSRLFAGEEPSAVTAVAHRHERGIDDITAGTLVFPNGIIASFACGMSVQADNTAYVCGADGYVAVPIPWKPPVQKAEFTIARGTPPLMDKGRAGAAPPPNETRYVDAGKELYALEADDFAATVLDGAPPAVTRQDTIGNMRVLDEMRRQMGI